MEKLSNLRDAIFKSNMSQSDVAMLACINEVRMSKLVNDKAEIKNSEKMRLCKVLRIPFKDLFPDPDQVSHSKRAAG